MTTNSTNPRHQKPEEQRLREFAFVMAIALTLLTALLLWKESVLALGSSAFAAVLFLFGIGKPLLLRGFERRWMQLAEKMSIVVSLIIVTLTFYLVITPMGVVMRLFGADLLKCKLDRNCDSYWQECEENGPATRPFDPY